MDAFRRELAQQRGLLEHLVQSELPALRMELAFLRADVQTLEERVGGEGASGYGAAAEEAFARGGLDLPPVLPPRTRRSRLSLDADDSDRESEEDITSKELHDDDTAAAISLEPNIWDCSVMLLLLGWRRGVDIMGHFNVLLVFLLFLANTVIQFLFVFAVQSMVDMNPYHMEAMLNSRLQSGQLYANLDHKSMRTKTQQVCSLKSYDLLGQTVEWVSDYLQKHTNAGRDSLLPGDIICTVAMLTWVISIYSEIRRSLQDLGNGVLSLPSMREVYLEYRGSLAIVSGVPALHKFSALLAMLPRVAIALMLGWYGMIFLAGTIEISELLMNAVALEFVKTIDEMIFEAIMPRRLMQLLRLVKIRVYRSYLPNETLGGVLHRDGVHSEKLQRQQGTGLYGQPGGHGHGHHRGVPVQSALVVIRLWLIASAVLTGYFWFLRPIRGYTEQAFFELCGANTNFTYMVHPVTRVPIFAKLDPYTKFSDDQKKKGTLRCFYAAQFEMVRMRAGFAPQYGKDNETLHRLVNGKHRDCFYSFPEPSALPCPEQDLGYFEWLDMVSHQEFYKSAQHCRDEDVFLQILRQTCLHPNFYTGSEPELQFFHELESCRDFREECESTDKYRLNTTWIWQMRNVCPRTCGLCQDHAASASAPAATTATPFATPPEAWLSPMSPVTPHPPPPAHLGLIQSMGTGRQIGGASMPLHR